MEDSRISHSIAGTDTMESSIINNQVSKILNTKQCLMPFKEDT